MSKYQRPNTKLPVLDAIPDGNIILIHFIRSNRKLDIFGEKLIVPKQRVYSYVKAVIVKAIHSLQGYLGEEPIECYPYEMPPKIFAGKFIGNLCPDSCELLLCFFY